MGKKKTFNGKEYNLSQRTGKKKVAERSAKTRREGGYSARVVKEGGAYSVYTRRRTGAPKRRR